MKITGLATMGLLAMGPLAMGLLAICSIARADDTGIHRGKQVFDKWCLPCHGDGTNFPGTIALKAKYKGQLPPALEQRTDLTAEEVKTFVRHGVSIMAPFRKTEISDAELADLAAYLAHHTKK